MSLTPRILCILGCITVHCPVEADGGQDAASDRMAAHFEALSSRLAPDDARPLAQFVERAGNIPGAKLAVLVPATNDPVRARFVAARVAELERHVRALAESAEVRKVPGNAGGDVLWLTVVPPPAVAQPEKASTSISQIPTAVETAPPSRSVDLHPAVLADPAGLRLADWVIRGVKHSAQGRTYAYVARMGSGEPPREIVEQQTDKEFGLVRDISQSAQGAWVVHTEIGWIGQVSSTAAPLAAGGN